MIPKIGLLQVGGKLDRDGITARAWVGNGSIKVAGERADAIVGKATCLVGVLVNEAFAERIYNEIERIWREHSAYTPVTTASGLPLTGHDILDTVQPQSEPGKILSWNSREYTYFKTDTITWYELLTAIQLTLSRYSQEEVRDFNVGPTISDKDTPIIKPVTEEVIIGLAQYEIMPDGTLHVVNRPSRRLKIGRWEPVLHIKKRTYELKERKAMAAYIGAYAYALKTTYGRAFQGTDWYDWCAFANYLLYANRPSGKPSTDDYLTAADITDIIWDYIGGELSEAYQYVGPHEGWLLTSILGAFLYLRQGILTAEADLVKLGGVGNPIQMRGEISYVFENAHYYTFEGHDIFLPPARNTSGDRYLLPSYCFITRPPGRSDETRMDLVQRDDIPTPTRVDLKFNEAALGTLDVEKDRIKELRWVPQADSRVSIVPREFETTLKLRCPRPESVSILETLLAKFTGGETYGKYGYYAPDRLISPWIDVTWKGKPALLDQDQNRIIPEVDLTGGAAKQGAQPPARGPGSGALPPTGNMEPGKQAGSATNNTKQGSEGIEITDANAK